VKRIGIFADVQNVYYTTREAFGRQFDYRSLWQEQSANGENVVANAYATDRGHAGQLRFQNALRQMGFKVLLKPFIQRSDGSAKGDWDVGITIDVLEAAPELDVVVLVSGDGDFDLLLRKIGAAYEVTTEVYGVPGLTAQALIEAADVYHQIGAPLLL
jgi:uncharacterized LabA/DUF88 family protein